MMASADFAVGPHRFEDLLGDFARNGLIDDPRQQTAQLQRRYPRSADIEIVAIQRAGQFAHDPIRGQLGLRRAQLRHHRLEVGAELAARTQDPGIVRRQVEVARKARGLVVGQLRQGRAHGTDERFVDLHRQEIRIREISIIVGLLLGAHRPGLVLVRVVETGFLHHGAAALEQVDLPRNFVVDRLLDESKGIQILDFGACAEFFAAARPHRHVGVAAKRPLLHVAVADLEITHQGVNLLHVRDRLLGRPHVGLGDDLEQRGAGAVQIDAAGVRQSLVQRLARVLLEMRAGDADGLDGPVVEHDLQPALLDHRQLVLTDLIALRQIRIEVILAREHRTARHLGADAQAELDRHAHGVGVQHRQHAGIRQIHQVGLGIRRRAVGRRRPREYFRFRRELRVDLQPDDHFPVAHCSYPGGERWCQSVAV